MRAFVGVRPQIEAAIFATKTHAQLRVNSSVNCSCGQIALFRCPECGVHDMVCAPCLVKMHPHHRLHHVEKWDGFAFVRTALFLLDHGVHLGHGGRACPHAPINGNGSKSVVVDRNGIHAARIFYCHCEGREKDYVQLLLARLFPATLDTPQTAFTFEVLHDFHVHNLTSKKTAHDYYRSLQKLTDNACPQKVPVRAAPHSHFIAVC